MRIVGIWIGLALGFMALVGVVITPLIRKGYAPAEVVYAVIPGVLALFIWWGVRLTKRSRAGT